jgi:hypothetical protein
MQHIPATFADVFHFIFLINGFKKPTLLLQRTSDTLVVEIYYFVNTVGVWIFQSALDGCWKGVVVIRD